MRAGVILSITMVKLCTHIPISANGRDHPPILVWVPVSQCMCCDHVLCITDIMISMMSRC